MAFNLVRYSQQDPQWKNNIIGGGPDTIGYVGCAMTCVAMYSSGWGYTETPGTLNKKLIANGGYVDEAIVWGAITRFYPQLKSTGLTICNGDAPISQINSSLASGQPVIVEVDFSPDAGLQTHWVLLYASQGNDYLMLDPWPYPSDTQPVTLMSRFSHGQTLARTIKAVAWYQCSAGSPVPTPVPGGSTGGSTPSTPPSTTPSQPPPVSTDLVIQVVPTATAGIKLHLQASQDSLANYAEMPGVPLSVIEAKAGALAKLGQNGQWIHVQDPSGHQGYVAAWLVQQSQITIPAPTTPPIPTTPPQPAPTPSTQPTPTPSTPAPTPSTPPPTGEPQRLQVVVVNVGSNGLIVRQQPSPGGTAVNVEKEGAKLTVIEPASTATPKIGVAGQWVAVKATNNQRGYVMAQYIKLK
jgi:hypothetical protein